MLLGDQVKVKTQKCPLDLATLLSLRGGLLSRSYSGKDTNRGKDKTAGTRRQGSSSLEEGRHLCRHGRDELRGAKNQMGMEARNPC